jgi:hypothetical protein
MSVLAQEIKNARKDLIRDYYQALNDLEKHRYIELNAASYIQKNVRRYLCEKRFILLKKVSLEIQKNFKGYLARAQHMQSVKDLSNDMNMQFYEYHLTIIQKNWRGFNSRRSKLDYHERKKYLQKIKQKNEETLTKVQEYSRAIQYEMERKREEDHRKGFNQVASNLHHLVSTRIIPGVYNPPHIPEEHKPQVFNTDIEAHLKSVFKNNLNNGTLKKTYAPQELGTYARNTQSAIGKTNYKK